MPLAGIERAKTMNVGAASHYSGFPTSIQRLRSSTLSLGQGPSHGMDPALTASKMGLEWTETSSNDHRSKATRIASRSDSRNSGLMSAVKVGAESLMSLPLAFDDRSARLCSSLCRRGMLVGGPDRPHTGEGAPGLPA